MRRTARHILCLSIAICTLVVCGSISLSAGEPVASKRIVLLETFDVPIVLEHSRYFFEAMKKMGYPRQSIRVLKAQGDFSAAQRLLKEAIQRKRPDVIVANATLAAEAALPIAKSSGIPLVFFVVSDPVGAGLVSAVDEPSHGPITGIVHSVPRATKVEMIMRILRPVKPKERPVRFGYIHSSYPSAVGDLRMLVEAAAKRGDVEFVSYQIPYEGEHFDVKATMARLIAGIEELDPKIDYWWIAQDPVGELELFVETIVERSAHPVVCGTNVSNTKKGALVHIAADTKKGAWEAAETVDSILKGTPVGSIPVHSPSKIDFGVNLSTAVRTGIAIPSDLLELAGSQVFR